jgi:hypothetical protein
MTTSLATVKATAQNNTNNASLGPLPYEFADHQAVEVNGGLDLTRSWNGEW